MSSLVYMSSSVTVIYTGHFTIFSIIKKIYNKTTKGPSLMEFFTTTGKRKKIW
jgi:hypothetical protein